MRSVVNAVPTCKKTKKQCELSLLGSHSRTELKRKKEKKTNPGFSQRKLNEELSAVFARRHKKKRELLQSTFFWGGKLVPSIAFGVP